MQISGTNTVENSNPAFHMQIDSLSFFNFPIEFNTHNTFNQKSHSRIQSMEQIK